MRRLKTRVYANEQSVPVDSDYPIRVSPVGLLIAFAIPLAVAILAAMLLAQAERPSVRLIGVPQELELVAVASDSEAQVSPQRAFETAIHSARNESDGRALDFALGRFREEPVTVDSGRLVWVVSLTPDKTAPVFITGDVRYDHSCDWAAHYDWVVAYVDATTGESLGYGTGASIDLSLAPTYVGPGNSDREYCERRFEEERRVAHSP